MTYFPKEVFSSIMEFCGETYEQKRDRLWKNIKVKRMLDNDKYNEMMGWDFQPWDLKLDRKVVVSEPVRNGIDPISSHYSNSNICEFGGKNYGWHSNWEHGPVRLGNTRYTKFVFRYTKWILKGNVIRYNDRVRYEMREITNLCRSCRAVERATRYNNPEPLNWIVRSAKQPSWKLIGYRRCLW